MEVLNWKNILLEWANRLNYLGRAHYSLNMVDIEAFYNEFRTNVTSKDIASKKLDSFMTSYFPEFHPIWTSEGKMCPDDYVYGYSLFMYFGCVRHPDENIQKICKDMQEESQLIVRAFLQNLLDSKSFSRETIKCVIESSAPAKMSDYVLALSPNKIGEMNMCPSTPKSKMLNDWNVETRQLKAQVETERFERGFLESQLKRKDDEINVLHQERRKFLADIQQLKSQLTEKDTENIPANYNDSQLEMLKRRLRKDIADKETEINKLQTQVHDLTASKQHLAEKLSFVESQYNQSVECSAKLANKLEQLTETSDKQQEHIKGLEITIKDYQKYFNDSNSKGNSLETSSENLEDSFAIAMANMPNQSTSSPENLGKVVDIQLREQITLYERLQEKCDRLEMENGQLSEQIEEHIQRTSALELECRQAMDENAVNVQRNAEKSEELAAISKELESSVATLQSLRSEFDSLTSMASDNQRTIETLSDAKSSLEQKLNVCESETAELRLQLETADAELKTASAERLELVAQHEQILRCKDDALAQLQMEANELRTSLSNAEQKNEESRTAKSSLEEKLNVCERETAELRLQLETADAKLKTASAERLELVAQHEQILRCKDDALAELQTEANELRASLSNAEQNLEESQTTKSSLEEKLKVCEHDIAELRLQLETADAELKTAVTERSELKAQHEQDLHRKDDALAELQTEANELRTSLSNAEQNLEESRTSKSSLEEKLNVCEHDIGELRLQLETANAELKTAVAERSELVTQHEQILRCKDDALAELQTEANELRASLSNAEQNHEESRTAKSSLEEKLNVNERETADLRLQLETADAKLKTASAERLELVAQHEQILRCKDDALNQLQTETNELRASLSNAEQNNEESRTGKSSLEEKLNVCKHDIADLRLQLETADAKLKTAVAERSELEAQHEQILRCKDDTLAELEIKIRSLSDQTDELRASLSDAEQNHAVIRTQNEDRVLAMEQEAEKLNAQLRNTISELAACQNDRDSIQRTAANLTDQIASLTAERQSIDLQLVHLSSSNEQVLAERDQLRDRLATLEKERVELEARLGAVESSRVDLEAQLNVSEDEKERLFLNLQEKIDEAEANELTVKEWAERCDSAAKESKLVCEAYEKRISDLTNTVAELSAVKENLSKINDDLLKETSQMKMELEMMRSGGEQYDSERNQFMQSIEELKSCKSANETEVRQLQQKLDESNNLCTELRAQLSVLESETQSLKKSVEDLESKRDALTNRLDVAEREVTESRDRLNQKDEKINEMSELIDSLKSESATNLVEKAKIEAELQNVADLLQRINRELEGKKKDSDEASQLVATLRTEVEQLKATETTMMAKNSELSEAHEVLVKQLEVAESSKDSLEVQCTSLTEELKAVRDRFSEIESKLADRCSEASARDDEVKALEMQVDSMKTEIASITEVAARKQSELNAMLQTSKEESAAMSSNADAKIEELKLSIKELTAQNESLSLAKAELAGQLSMNKVECESFQRSSTDYKSEIEALAASRDTLSLRVSELTSETKRLADDLEKAKQENLTLTDENVDLATEIEKIRTEFTASETSNRDKIDSLKSELNRLETANTQNHQRIDELQKSVDAKSNDHSAKDKCAKLEADLEIAMSDLEAKIQECRQSQDTNAQLVHDNKILAAKLTQHRKQKADQEETWEKEKAALIEENDKKCTEIRFELEVKLSKMKERMKHIYTEETSKSKEKHEKQERELINYKHQCQLLNDKNEQFVTHVRSISAQMYKLNEQILELKKENEFLKNKLRLAESNPRQSRLFSLPNFGSNLKIEMEDEQGEVFNNTYLADLKSGVTRTSPNGRESIRLSELQQRNSMAAKHLRSTYAAQYGDQNLREEDLAMPYFNDSMFSNNQLDVRRGTLYQRPGPPTPSKNGGRLSFGGGSIINASDLFPKDILREQNTNNAKTKTTPGKLMSMFSSSKHKENDARKAITKPIYTPFTSTPRQKSKWARDRQSIREIKLNSSERTESCDDDDAASILSNDSLLSKTNGRRLSITRRFSIISKSKQVSAVSALIRKNRSEYRQKNHSKRQQGFEQSREICLKMDDDVDDANNFQMVLHEGFGCIQTDELFPLDLRPSEKFEILTTRTVSEHPYSNEPTAIEANESSLTSSAMCPSKTMGNIIMYGKIPRIKANEIPHRELIRLNQRSGSIWLKLMDWTKECVLVLAVLVVYASYVMWNFFKS